MRTSMKAAAALTLVVGLASFGCNDATEDLEVFRADLTPGNEVPARNSPATGTAGFTFDGTTIRYSIEVDDLNNTHMGHIHSGAAGTTGPVRVWLYPVGATAPGPFVTVTDKRVFAEGTITAANVMGISFDQLVNEMRAGTAYVNFHSMQYQAGEIRGQVRLVDVD
jgi:CHRD domain-containing protein